jgi:hypothetical protein
MSIYDQIEQAAKDWNRTRDPRHKDRWYKLINDWHILNNLKRRDLPSEGTRPRD